MNNQIRLICPRCERVQMVGKDYFQAEYPSEFTLDGAVVEECPECKKRPVGEKAAGMKWEPEKGAN